MTTATSPSTLQGGGTIEQIDIRAIVPEVGIYEDVPADTYHAWDAASNSRLSHLLRSPAHCREAIDNPPDPTPAQILGTAAHYCILEPDLFEQRYTVPGRCEATKRDGQRCTNVGVVCRNGEWFCGVRGHDPGADYTEHFEAVHAELKAQGAILYTVSPAGSRYYGLPSGERVRVADHDPNEKTQRWMRRWGVRSIRVDQPPYGDRDPRRILTPDGFDQCRRMAESVWGHTSARALLEDQGQRELSVVWDDPDTGTRCKMRADHVAEGISAIVDIKTTPDASKRAFSRTIYQRGYYRQADMYLWGMSAHGRAYDDFVIIAVEKDPPYAVMPYRIKDKALEAGHDELLILLRRYAQCHRSGHWPGYGEDVQEITLPPWARNQLEDDD